MFDYSMVNERLAVGAALTSDDDVKELLAHNLNHVIDCRAEFDDAALFTAYSQIHYLYNGTQDDGQPKDVSWFQKGIEFSLDALDKPRSGVYIHCAAGYNRAPSMMYAVLMSLGFNLSDAENMIRKVRNVGLAYKSDAIKAVVQLGYVIPITGSAFGEII